MVYSVRKYEVYDTSGNAVNKAESIYAGTQEAAEIHLQDDTGLGRRFMYSIQIRTSRQKEGWIYFRDVERRLKVATDSRQWNQNWSEG